MKGILALCLVSLLVFSSCAVFEPKKEETAQVLLDRGMEELNKGNYRLAILTFRQLIDWYPFSKHAVTAELRSADAFYEVRMYEDAIRAYRAFESLHPGHEEIPYVLNQIGLSYLSGVGSVDRDQTSTEEALRAFQLLLRQHPDSVYADEARKNIQKCQTSLAQHELRIGLFYYKKKNYEAALGRFQAVLNDYPDTEGTHPQAREYIRLCKEALNATSSE